MATAVIDYYSLLVTACHRLFTYHCLAPVLAGKNEHHLVLFAGKSEHHLDPVNTCFTPTIFYVHGSQVKVHPGARACGFRFRHQRTYAHTHTRTQPTVSIDSIVMSWQHLVTAGENCAVCFCKVLSMHNCGLTSAF